MLLKNTGTETISFHPSPLVKGSIALAVSFISTIYATKQFRDASVQAIQQALEATNGQS